MQMLSSIGMLPEYADTVKSWYNALPERMRSQINDDFDKAYEDDLIYYAVDDEFVSCGLMENKGNKIFELHLLSPRRLKREIMLKIVLHYFTANYLDDRVDTIIMNVRKSQRILMDCLVQAGVRFTGWNKRENKDEFKLMVWNKSIAKPLNLKYY